VDEAPQAAERLLKLMKNRKGVEPDSLSYHGVLDAWAHTGTEESLVRVKQIYQHMQGLYAEGKDIKPSIRTVNVMVHAHGRVAANFIANPNLYDPDKAFQAAEAAHDLLRQMRVKFEETNDPDFAPDVMTYTSVMDAFARCGTFKGTQRAGQLLAELKQQYQKTHNPRLRPNVRTYTSLISAWSRTNSPEAPMQAETLLKEMYDNPAIRPNSRTFTSVIQCWGKSRDSTKAKRALKILRDMKELYKKVGEEDIRPTIITYNSAITACAMVQGTPEQQTEALKISFAILKAIEADDYVQTNHITFSTLIKGVGYLMPAGDERNKVAKAVFDKARTAGLVDSFVVTNLRKAVDAKVMQEIFNGIAPDRNGDYDFTRIPADWSKNVK
jgi:hypothetical protein